MIRIVWFLATAAIALGCMPEFRCGARTDGPSQPPTVASGRCSNLFGRPNEHTGLSGDLCRPTCDCNDGQAWTAPTYTEQDIAALRRRRLLDPPASLHENPYEATEPPTNSSGVCAVVADEDDPEAYRLQNFPDVATAKATDAEPSHRGSCGVCSTLQDLAVYMANPDLTDPVRSCGLEGFWSSETNLECLLDLGFTRPCAQIWLYNTRNTRNNCLWVCLSALDDPYLQPDGSLNDCLQCDEDHSGPIFKAVAGRTRRNTGLPTPLCRPCDEVFPVVHRY